MRFKEGTRECVLSSTVMTNGARGLLASKQKVKNPIITRLLGGPHTLAPFWQEPSFTPL